MANNNRIKGITVEIGGDTTNLGKALDSITTRSNNITNELRDINKLLKLDPGNTDLLAQKQKVLADALATTSDKLDALKEAEKQVQKQFERGDATEDQVRALQREIVATEKEMQDYERAAKETADQLDNFGKKTRDAEKDTNKFGSTMKTVGTAAVAGITAAATAATAAAAALAGMSAAAAEYADNILTSSTVTGISTQKLQEYAYAAELVDVSVETLTKSHAKQIKSMKSVQDGSKTMVAAYDALGVSAMNADGSLRDGETVYWEIIDALGKMENETERDALAMQILGKSAQELNPLIEAGSERMAELAQEAQDVGAVLSDDALNSLGAFDDSIQRLKGSAGAAKNALGTVLLPELTSLTTTGAALVAEFTQNLNASGGGLEGFVATIETMAPEVATKVGDIIGGIIEKAAELLPTVINVGVELVVAVATAIVEQIPALVEAVTEVLVKCLPKLLEGAVTLLMAIVEAVGEILPPLIEAVPDIVMAIVDTLLDALPVLVDGALALLLAIVDAIPLLIEKLVPEIPRIITTIVNGLLDATPQLISAAFTLLSAIRQAIPQACVALLKSLPEIGSTILGYLGGLPEKVIEIGKELISGLWKGITDKDGWLHDKITGWVGDVTGWLKKLFGINSPSKVTAYMGEMLDEGLAVGIEDHANAPKKAMSDLTGDMLDTAGALDGVAIERQVNSATSASAAASAAQSAGTLSKLDQILEAIKRGHILMLDGSALVGATADKMNNALGQSRVLAGRGAR